MEWEGKLIELPSSWADPKNLISPIPKEEQQHNTTAHDHLPISIHDLPLNKKRWSQEEHWLFIQGLALHGKGNWKSITRVVKTRTSTQMASHARNTLIISLQSGKAKEEVYMTHSMFKCLTKMTRRIRFHLPILLP
ncbi:hypothetical protein VNO78_12548 [Psophocarpus tetragonolobus]|uniref:Uncharacterized protein n=1 Tax=Psophocarpus tetragonolobus TaxID=3891 RepID=A0AAN9SVS4_PSOTE